ncbi:lytic transglycosylase domain-containing protein [Methylobacterium amylolyticum]|uniref:lytic transglycosylase domain-containing protein n=1 Tax=Methylobacterium sp. NEAU 140 TaxID=3064945 RepID=UPI003520D146
MFAALSGGAACAASLLEAAPPARSEADLLRQMREAAQAPPPAVLRQAGGSVFSVPGTGLPRGNPVLRQSFEPLAEAAAFQHGIGTTFFKRLIRQESGYNPAAVSRAGAQGIAQFMPGTAAMMGLDDPFDPGKALPKAAELLALLHRRLGNEGLAAAAYNAGEGRIRAWLAGRSALPLETELYVRAITGREAQDWAPAGTPTLLRTALPPARAAAGRSVFGRMSPEWAFALTLLPKAAPGAVPNPARSAALPPSPSAPRAAAAPALRGEASLCQSLGRGCIVAAVY